MLKTHPKGEVMKVKGSRRLVARLGLALAVAAIAVPSAQAMPVNFTDGSGSSVRLYADDLHVAMVPTPAKRQYADDLHAPLVSTSLPASNVRTDASTVRFSLPASNVRTDAASFQVVKDKPRNYAPIDPRGRLDLIDSPSQPAAPDSSGIDWIVAGIGAVLGAFGLMLLIGVVYFTRRHDRGSGLAAT
jgi:hypothetical protein